MARTIYNDGGPAFPAVIPLVHNDDQGKDYPDYAESGMSLRDWFAGQALPEVYRRLENMAASTPGNEGKLIAMACYSIADAMLTERKRT